MADPHLPSYRQCSTPGGRRPARPLPRLPQSVARGPHVGPEKLVRAAAQEELNELFTDLGLARKAASASERRNVMLTLLRLPPDTLSPDAETPIPPYSEWAPPFSDAPSSEPSSRHATLSPAQPSPSQLSTLAFDPSVAYSQGAPRSAAPDSRHPLRQRQSFYASPLQSQHPPADSRPRTASATQSTGPCGRTAFTRAINPDATPFSARRQSDAAPLLTRRGSAEPPQTRTAPANSPQSKSDLSPTRMYIERTG
jgi:hypothetical protein